MLLSDPAPAELTYVSAGAPCTSSRFPCNLGALGAGQSITVLAVTFAVAPDFVGTLTNTASITSDQTTQSSSSASSSILPNGSGGTPEPVPLDARWMLLAQDILLTAITLRAVRTRR